MRFLAFRVLFLAFHNEVCSFVKLFERIAFLIILTKAIILINFIKIIMTMRIKLKICLMIFSLQRISLFLVRGFEDRFELLTKFIKGKF